MSRSSSACVEFNSNNVVLPTSSRNSRLYARLKTGRRDEYVQKHCDLQDKKHENTVLSGEREAAASVVLVAILSAVVKRDKTSRLDRNHRQKMLAFAAHISYQKRLNKVLSFIVVINK